MTVCVCHSRLLSIQLSTNSGISQFIICVNWTFHLTIRLSESTFGCLPIYLNIKSSKRILRHKGSLLQAAKNILSCVGDKCPKRGLVCNAAWSFLQQTAILEGKNFLQGKSFCEWQFCYHLKITNDLKESVWMVKRSTRKKWINFISSKHGSTSERLFTILCDCWCASENSTLWRKENRLHTKKATSRSREGSFTIWKFIFISENSQSVAINPPFRQATGLLSLY